MSDVARAVDGTFKPGSVANPNGRPVGSRNKFSDSFYRDIAAKWATDGPAILDIAATVDPVRFLAVCAALMPKDVSLTLTARLPGNLEPDEWQLACEVFGAVKQALPNAGERGPGDVLEFVLQAIREKSAQRSEVIDVATTCVMIEG